MLLVSFLLLYFIFKLFEENVEARKLACLLSFDIFPFRKPSVKPNICVKRTHTWHLLLKRKNTKQHLSNWSILSSKVYYFAHRDVNNAHQFHVNKQRSAAKVLKVIFTFPSLYERSQRRRGIKKTIKILYWQR